jgi:hypothetical protein
MTARNTKGVDICMTNAKATAAELVPTAIAKSSAQGDNRAVVTLADVATIKVHDIIVVDVGATGFPEIDGKEWTVGAVDGTTKTLTLNGTDLSGTTATLVASPKMKHYASDQMTCLCLSTLEFQQEKGATISVATFCDPSASIPSASTTAGTIDIGGFVDVKSADYKALLAAEADGLERIYRIKLPDNGEIVFPGIISTFGWQIPIDGAIAWTASLALGSRPRHLF